MVWVEVTEETSGTLVKQTTLQHGEEIVLWNLLLIREGILLSEAKEVDHLVIQKLIVRLRGGEVLLNLQRKVDETSNGQDLMEKEGVSAEKGADSIEKEVDSIEKEVDSIEKEVDSTGVEAGSIEAGLTETEVVLRGTGAQMLQNQIHLQAGGMKLTLIPVDPQKDLVKNLMQGKLEVSRHN